MGFASTVTAKGQLTLPADIRAHLGATPGARVIFVIGADGEVRVRLAPPDLQGLRGIVRPRGPVSGALIDDWAREARETEGVREE